MDQILNSPVACGPDSESTRVEMIATRESRVLGSGRNPSRILESDLPGMEKGLSTPRSTDFRTDRRDKLYTTPQAYNYPMGSFQDRDQSTHAVNLVAPLPHLIHTPGNLSLSFNCSTLASILGFSSVIGSNHAFGY